MLNKRYEADGFASIPLNELQKEKRDVIAAKVAGGHYVFETVECPVCGCRKDADFAQLARKDRYGLSVSTQICKRCGLVLTRPRMNAASYAEFYDQEQKRLYVGEEMPSEDYFAAQVKRGETVFEFVRKHIPDFSVKKTVLDVGCGAGGMLVPFKRAGFAARGVDIIGNYVELGKRKGLDVAVGGIDTLAAESGTFDIIIYSHVLEHLSDAERELTKIRGLLAPGGVVYVEVPGLKNIGESYDGDFLRLLQNAHVWIFTKTSLGNLFRKSGFSMVVGDEYVRAVFSVSKDRTPDTIKNEYRAVMSFLRRAEAKLFLRCLRERFLRR
jgi:2-polyprenyl-3-methyl-5-hydroxy-6-metoxy-1,4-benzoquinol methylase